MAALRLYRDLAGWWPLLSPPAEYEAEAADLLPRLLGATDPAPRTLLELGAGGGSLAYHLKRHLRLTLTDISPQMLAVSRAVNSECEHLPGDMRTLRLERTFDLVLIHDAIVYATTPDAVQAILRTAAAHCRPGGALFVLPDHVRETFAPHFETGGHDAPDGRGLRYVEGSWDPDPGDDTYTLELVLLLRDATGRVTVEHERHLEGLFGRARWRAWLEAAGFRPAVVHDPWDRDVFIGRRESTQDRATEPNPR